MQNTFKFEKLNFTTAGMPRRTGKGSYPEAFDVMDKKPRDLIKPVVKITW